MKDVIMGKILNNYQRQIKKIQQRLRQKRRQSKQKTQQVNIDIFIKETVDLEVWTDIEETDVPVVDLTVEEIVVIIGIEEEIIEIIDIERNVLL